MTDYDDVLLGIEFLVRPHGHIPHRHQLRSFYARRLVFPRLADIEQGEALAALELLLYFIRLYFEFHPIISPPRTPRPPRCNTCSGVIVAKRRICAFVLWKQRPVQWSETSTSRQICLRVLGAPGATCLNTRNPPAQPTHAA